MAQTFTTYQAAAAFRFDANMKYGLGSYQARQTVGGWLVEPCFCGLPANPLPVPAQRYTAADVTTGRYHD